MCEECREEFEEELRLLYEELQRLEKANAAIGMAVLGFTAKLDPQALSEIMDAGLERLLTAAA